MPITTDYYPNPLVGAVTIGYVDADGVTFVPVSSANPLPGTGGGGGGGGAVTVANGADVTQGAIADAAWSGSGTGTVVAVLKALWTKLGSVVLGAGTNVIGAVNVNGTEYEAVAASQTDQPLGATGATGDLFSTLLIIPATTSPGAVSVKDGAGTAITVFTGGASSVSNLVPFTVALNAVSTAGAWKVTTGANVSVVATGSFT